MFYRGTGIIKTMVVKIEITHDDGTVQYAEGMDAESVWRWLMGCESFKNAHDYSYPGPYLKVKERPKVLEVKQNGP